jgi:predicted HTH domain antitoxin
MSTIAVELDNDLVRLLRERDSPLDETIREIVVLDLYRQQKLSRGRSAELLGLSLRDFLDLASRAGIPYFSLTSEEWEQELMAAKELARERA